MGAGEGLGGLARVQRRLLPTLLRKEDRSEYLLDLDATPMVAENEAGQWTYQGENGYMPLVGTLAENGLIVGDACRDGTTAPAAGNLAFIRYGAQPMPEGQRIVAVRADRAADQAALFNACEGQQQRFAIGADLDTAVTAVIAGIPAAAWMKWCDAESAETVHRRPKPSKPFADRGAPSPARRFVRRQRAALPLHGGGQQPHRAPSTPWSGLPNGLTP